MKIYIYTLSDPDSLQVRYVGKSKKPNNRYSQHLIDAKNNKYKCYKDNWIRSLLKTNKKPIIDIIDELESNDWEWLEQYWISQFKAWGFKLTNMTDGGDGNNNQIFSPESLIKRSLKLKGIKRPNEVIEKIKKSNTGKKLSQETKNKLRNTNLGKIQSLETRLKKSKPIIMYNLNGEEINRFSSLSLASSFLKCRKSNISNSIIRKSKYKKYKFKYINKDIVEA